MFFCLVALMRGNGIDVETEVKLRQGTTQEHGLAAFAVVLLLAQIDDGRRSAPTSTEVVWRQRVLCNRRFMRSQAVAAAKIYP